MWERFYDGRSSIPCVYVSFELSFFWVGPTSLCPSLSHTLQSQPHAIHATATAISMDGIVEKW